MDVHGVWIYRCEKIYWGYLSTMWPDILAVPGLQLYHDWRLSPGCLPGMSCEVRIFKYYLLCARIARGRYRQSEFLMSKNVIQKMVENSIQPRILLVTPEICLAPDRSGKNSDYLNCKPSGFAGFLAHWVGDLSMLGADVHIAQPNYRNVFATNLRKNSAMKRCRLPENRVHLAQDRAFFYAGEPESNSVRENLTISLAFQREVIHQIMPLVKPDLIHCHDWMCGLIPAVAEISGIPCILTLQNCETAKCMLSVVEDTGIDAASFWQHLFFDRYPANYEESRATNAIDFLLSGVFAAQHVSIAGPDVLLNITQNIIRFPEAPLGKVLSEKLAVDCHSAVEFQPAGMQYVDLYERLLRRPVLKTGVKRTKLRSEFSRHLNLFNLSPELQMGT
jgi:hypothetical protein